MATKQNSATRDGQSIGAWLTERAPHVLLTEYATNRKIGLEGKATAQLSASLDELRSALGASANDPTVVAALHRLDGAVWNVAVEHEDRAWHAAWTAATRLIGRQ